MDKNIKNIIDAQIEQQIYKPTQRDVVPHSALLVVDRDGKMDVTHGEGTSIPRLQQFLTTLQPIKLPEMSVLFLTHDYSDPKHYEDKPNFSICFGKLRNQRYITIPNLHLLGGIVDSMFREVSTHDCGMFAKEKSSIFAGGPNCDHDGVRIKYGVKGLDPDGVAISETATERDKFLARNGLLHGKIYGLAVERTDLAALLAFSCSDKLSEVLGA